MACRSSSGVTCPPSVKCTNPHLHDCLTFNWGERGDRGVVARRPPHPRLVTLGHIGQHRRCEDENPRQRQGQALENPLHITSPSVRGKVRLLLSESAHGVSALS